jgi:hypothetical protein
MNFEKLLAENMLRFGVKNLKLNALSKYIHEQTAVPINVYQKNAATTTIAQLPKLMQTYNPQNGTVTITDGNPWLATQRAKALQSFLTTQAQQTLKIPVDAKSIVITQTIVQGKGDENQYTIGKLKAKLKQARVTQAPLPYSILYNFYDINGVPHILVTKPGQGAPISKDPGAPTNSETSTLSKFADRIENSILVRQSTQGASSSGQKTQVTDGIFIPITSGYVSKNKGRLYFTDNNQYETMKQFIASYTDLGVTGGKPEETGDLKGKTKLQTSFLKNAGGGGNYIFGDLGSGRTAKILAGKEAGTNITIKRMEPSKIGAIPGDGIAAGNAEKWVEIGSFKLDKENGIFPDNLITIDPTKYQTIIKLIQDELANLRAEGYVPIQLTAEIQGFASTDNANNRCPKGYKPDHAWGGPVTPDKWITLQ